jgi:hypothetical protein
MKIALPGYRAFLIAAGFLLSLWLRALYPPWGIWAPHDDALFLRIAISLGEGAWLGPYDSLTLAKGMFYSLFISVNHAIGLPLKLSEHFVYLLASLLGALIFARLCGKRWLAPLLFLVLAFSPIYWMSEQARVIRDALYPSLGLIFFALMAHYLFGSWNGWRQGVVVGLVAGCYWLTREEGVWLLPAIGILVVYWSYRQYRIPDTHAGRHVMAQTAGRMARHLAPPLLAFVAVIAMVNSINLMYYGVFRNNDIKTKPFVSAYGALTRIKHENEQRFVTFPRDARAKAYQVSAAARELQPFFEGYGGRAWAMVSWKTPPPWGCADNLSRCNTEILGGWVFWALRDAVSSLGYYRSAKDADAFYQRLADEINAACTAGTIPCEAPRSSLVPVWRDYYPLDTWHASGAVFSTLISLNRGQVGVPPSVLDRYQRQYFRSVINSRLSRHDNRVGNSDGATGTQDALRAEITRFIARGYAMVSAPLFILSIICFLALILMRVRMPSFGVSDLTLALLTAFLTAVLTRVTLLGLLEVTAFPSNNMLYLSATVPFYLAFIVVSIGLTVSAIRDRLRS